MQNDTSPWQIKKIKSSNPKLKLRVGHYNHPNIEEKDIRQIIFFFTGRGEWIEKYNAIPQELKSVKINESLSGTIAVKAGLKEIDLILATMTTLLMMPRL